MTKYPVFRSLYKPLFMGGVPLPRCYRKDQYFLSILMDVAGLRGKTSRPRRKSDEVMEEISDTAENS